MLLNVQIEAWSRNWDKLTEEDYRALRSVIPQLPEKKQDVCYREYIVDDDGLRELARYNIDVELKPLAENNMLVKLQDRIDALELRNKSDAQAVDMGAIVQIHIPDLGLLYITEVTHLDDCCTDELQRHLDDGWHILAVCPPNAQRRPDYILGRRKK